MTRVVSLVLLAGGLTACRSARPAPPVDPPVPVAFDHVIVAVDSFARGVALLRAATGVTPLIVEPDPAVLARMAGGEGTQSALLSNGPYSKSAIIGLGRGRYLELVGPGAAGLERPVVRDIFAIYRDLEPIAWGIRTPDASALREALLSRGQRPGTVHGGAREIAAAGSLRWRTLTPWANINTLYPAFIEWDPSGTHPSVAAPEGCTLVTFTLGSPSADAMRAGLSRAGVRATVAATVRPEMSLTLDCPTGEVRLPARAPASAPGR